MSGNPVVTGIGVTAPNGMGVDEFWKSVLDGRSAIGPITRFDPERYPASLFGEIAGFRARDHLPSRLIPQTDRMTQLALVATGWALSDADIDLAGIGEFDMSVVTASASGGFEFAQHELEKLWSKGSEYVSAYQSFAWFYAVNTGQISIRHGVRGPSGVVVTEQAGGLDAVAQAQRQIRKGVRLVITGGVDGSLCPWGWVAQLATGSLTRATEPHHGYQPFSTTADGFVPGEGGAILLLEEHAAALARGATPYGEIAGYAATFDAAASTGRPPGLARAAELAIERAGLAPGDIDVVFADAAGLPGLDSAESAAITGIFGPHGVPVTVPKTMTGRLYSGAGSLDLASALLSIRDQVIPPTVHVPELAPEHAIDLVRDQPRPAPVGAALVLARGRGGFNSAMVVRDVVDDGRDSHDAVHAR